MSTVRNERWQVVSRGDGGFSSPRKYGLSGGMPAEMRSVEGSLRGTSDADGRRLWSRSSKYDRKRSRISSDVTRLSLGLSLSSPTWRRRNLRMSLELWALSDRTRRLKA